MRRFTMNDWELINAALALYEADVEDLDLSDREYDELKQHVTAVRSKVFQRLTIK